jgi:perosamine synthetase
MLTTNEAAIATRARSLRSHATSVPAFSRHEAQGIVSEHYRELGFNYRMSDVHAAIGIEQLRKLESLLARRRAIAARYDEAFGSLRQVQMPPRPPYADHAYQSYGVLLTSDCRCGRDELLSGLVALGIACRRGIAPIHVESFIRDRIGAVSLPVTEHVAAHAIFLPMYASLSEADQRRTIDAVVGLVTR